MTIDDLKVKPGDPILPAWNRLLAWARETEQVQISGAEIHSVQQVPGLGKSIVFLGGNSWDHPFRVSASKGLATIRPGLINAAAPTIRGVPLDGLLPDGTQVAPPQLEFTAAYGGDYRSFIGIEVRIDPATGAPAEGDAEWAQVAHRCALDPKVIEGGFPDRDGIGFEPLAILYWTKGGELRAVRQNVHHNLTHRFKAGDDSQPGRHFFWGA